MPEHTLTSPLTLPADYFNRPPRVWLDLIGQSYLERGLTKQAIQFLNECGGLSQVAKYLQESWARV